MRSLLSRIALVAMLMGSVMATTASALDPADLCQIAKARAATQALSKMMNCRTSRYRADALGKDFNKLECLFNVGEKLIATFARLESRYPTCPTLGNGPSVAADIENKTDLIFDSL